MPTEITGSKLGANPATAMNKQAGKYGQNNFDGSSSDLPGQRTTAGFLDKVVLPDPQSNGQTRKLSGEGKERVVPTHPGMSAPRAGLNTAYKGGKR